MYRHYYINLMNNHLHKNAFFHLKNLNKQQWRLIEAREMKNGSFLLLVL